MSLNFLLYKSSSSIEMFLSSVFTYYAGHVLFFMNTLNMDNLDLKILSQEKLLFLKKMKQIIKKGVG